MILFMFYLDGIAYSLLNGFLKIYLAMTHLVGRADNIVVVDAADVREVSNDLKCVYQIMHDAHS